LVEPSWTIELLGDRSSVEVDGKVAGDPQTISGKDSRGD
jgi:hypothetical protein